MIYAADSGAIIQSHEWVEPEAVFTRLNEQNKKGALWLDSSNARQTQAQTQETKILSPHNRYSFIVADPYKDFILYPHDIKARDAMLAELDHICTAHKNIWQDLPAAIDTQTPPFRGGIAGIIGYDLLAPPNQENQNTPPLMPLMPLMVMGVYASVLAFDMDEKSCFIIATGLPATTPSKRQQAAQNAIDAWCAQLENLPAPKKPTLSPTPPKVQSNMGRGSYMQAVQDIIEHILAGDIFQANLAQCFTGTLPEGDTPFHYYQRLRHISPAPFSAFGQFGEWSMASASPERFLRTHKNMIESHPIKGTRRRGHDTTSDAALKQALQSSDKDRAENIMIVDLLRNDLSKTCRDHSVHVPVLCAPQSFANVHHLVSVIRAELRADTNPFAALQAAFPGGSITGAPKKRAMEIIAAFEPTPRALSYGTCGYIGFDGTMDSSIIIRTAFMRGRHIHFHVGGGIVADSDAESEYNESLDKARDLLGALGITSQKETLQKEARQKETLQKEAP